MSSTTLQQLRETYARVIEVTLRRVYEAGVLREAAVIDELRERWQAATERELAAMEAQLSQPAEGGVQSVSMPSAFGDPSERPRVLQESGGARYRPMEGVSFAEPQEVSAPLAKGRRRGPGAFEGSHVQSAGDPALQAPSPFALPGDVGRESLQPPRKKPKAKGTQKRPAEPLPLRAAAGRPNPAAASSGGGGGEEEEEYEGAFEGAEIIVSQRPPGGGLPPGRDQPPGGGGGGEGGGGPEGEAASSQGSELGSDFDDSEFDEQETENVLFAEFARIRRTKRRWSVLLKHGVLRVNGVECLFSSAAGVFDTPAADEVAPSAPSAPAPAVPAPSLARPLPPGDEIEDEEQRLALPSPPPPEPPSFRGGGRGIGDETPFVGLETPQLGADTPFLGSETPQLGGETPRRDGEGEGGAASSSTAAPPGGGGDGAGEVEAPTDID